MKLLGDVELTVPQLLLGTFLVAIVLTIAGATVTSAATFGAYNSAWDGTSEFRETIDERSTGPPVLVDTAAYDRFEADTTLVIILSPQMDYTDAELTRLRGFLDRGGTILIAEDRRTETNELLADLDTSARIDGRPLRDPRQFYRSPELPVITTSANSSETQNVSQFTLNRGTVVETIESPQAANESNSTVLARTSTLAYIDTNDNGQLDRNETLQPRPVLVSEQVSSGRVIILGDPSVFINQMLERDGNQRFADQIATSHQRVVIDASHSGSTPPAIVLWLWLQRTGWAQALVGGIGLTAIGGATSQRVQTQLRRLVATVDTRSEELENITYDDTGVADFLQRKYPDWDAERIERITGSMNRLKDDTPRETDE